MVHSSAVDRFVISSARDQDILDAFLPLSTIVIFLIIPGGGGNELQGRGNVLPLRALFLACACVFFQVELLSWDFIYKHGA